MLQQRQRHNVGMSSLQINVLLMLLALGGDFSARGMVLWSLAGPIEVHENGSGTNVLDVPLKHNDNSRDTLYFKFEVDPLSDVGTEEYLAAFEFFEGGEERLAVGNSLKAWAYSAFNTLDTGPNNKVQGDLDLHSAHPEIINKGDVLNYELPRRGNRCTIVFKVQFVPAGDDLVTAWMNPNLSQGATEESQPEELTTKFKANASFDQIRLRHQGNGDGWIFRNLMVTTAFGDLVVVHFWQELWFICCAVTVMLAAVGGTVRIVEKRKYQSQLRQAEQERALERERARIAQDLHDELGSLLTRISLLGGLLRSDMNNPGQVEATAEKISGAADQTVRALEEIVWAVRPGSDTLQSLVDYIAHFAIELFEGNSTRCRLDLPADLPTHTLHPDVRHNIFLIIKEALNNALKHAGGSVVQVQIRIEAGKLKILIGDNGKGFDAQASAANSERNGLENMRRRALAVGGQLEVTSAPGIGTRVEFQVNLPH